MVAPPPNSELARLMARFAHAGRVAWIGARPAREARIVHGGTLRVGDRVTAMDT